MVYAKGEPYHELLIIHSIYVFGGNGETIFPGSASLELPPSKLARNGSRMMC